jgi:hypothetical protein
LSELRLQKLVCDAVKAEGGHAFKLANRFLVGVSDLFVQLPARQTMVIEAKLVKCAKMSWPMAAKVTVPQALFLRKMWEAGCLTGVVLFVQCKGKLFVGMASGGDFSKDCTSVEVSLLTELKNGSREEGVAQVLKEFESSKTKEAICPKNTSTLTISLSSNEVLR